MLKLWIVRSRKLGDLQVAEEYYLQGLGLNPLHIGINEYLGELYVKTGRIDKQRRLVGS